MLDTQYRMHTSIASFPSARFYNGLLRLVMQDGTINPNPNRPINPSPNGPTLTLFRESSLTLKQVQPDEVIVVWWLLLLDKVIYLARCTPFIANTRSAPTVTEASHGQMFHRINRFGPYRFHNVREGRLRKGREEVSAMSTTSLCNHAEAEYIILLLK